MGIKEKMEKFNKRWNVGPADSQEAELLKFKTRILNIFKDIDRHVTKESITLFCQYFGIEEIWKTSYSDRCWSENIINRLRAERSAIEFYRLIEVIFALDITQSSGYRGEFTYSEEILYKKVREAVDFSNINVAITVTDGEVVLYPKGEKMLDEEVVNSPLSFLSEERASHFVQALEYYQSKNPIKSAESLRRSIEEYLRYKLKNAKGLDANIAELLKRLKSDGRDPQVRNIIFKTFEYLDQYFNENSKHNDGDIDENENEFLIYQVGLLMRYIENVVKD